MVNKLGLGGFAFALVALFAAAPDMARSEGRAPSEADRATARAQIETLSGRFDAAIKRAKREQEGAGRTSGAQQAVYCERFQRQIRTAERQVSQINELEETAYQEVGGFEPLRGQIQNLTDEGCPRGTFFEPTTKLAQQFRQELALAARQAQQAILKSDDVAFQARKVDLNNLIERGQYLGREEKDSTARYEIERLTSAAQRIRDDLPQRAPEPIRLQILTPGLPPPVTTPQPLPTGPQLPAPQGGFRPLSFSANFGGAVLDAPTSSFIGLRSPGTDERQPLRFESSRTDVGTQFNASLRFGGLPNPFGGGAGSFRFGGSFASFSQSTFVSSFDPGPNNFLIIGTGVDPFGPGFSIPAGGAGTFNDVRNYRYSRDIDRYGFFTQYSVPVKEKPNGLRVSALFRLDFSRTNIEEEQSASLPNVPFDLRNTTELGVNTVTPSFGLQAKVPISPTIMLTAGGRAGAAVSRASGSDNFTFASPVFNGAQQNPLAQNHVGFAWQIESGMTIRLNQRFSLAVNGFYGQSNSYPVIERTGEAGQRSSIRWETEDGLGAIFRIQRSYGN